MIISGASKAWFDLERFKFPRPHQLSAIRLVGPREAGFAANLRPPSHYKDTAT